VLSVTDRAKLLLVDDRPENLLALEAILEPLEADLVRAASGEEALRRLLQDEFAAILLDVQMPGMDGFQTAELIKQRERTRHVPILFLTAISKDAEHVFRGYTAGAVDYLMKPFDPLVLRTKVAVFIELWQKTMELRRRDALLAEQELAAVERESEERYRSLADAVPQIVWTADTDGVVTYRNERWYELTGLPRDRTVAWQDFVHPEDLAAAGDAWEEARRARKPLDAEYRIRLADGT
jgi:CheY-like chemotaxis protein